MLAKVFERRARGWPLCSNDSPVPEGELNLELSRARELDLPVRCANAPANALRAQSAGDDSLGTNTHALIIDFVYTYTIQAHGGCGPSLGILPA